MSKAYYNEIDKNKAAWLRELIACDLIAPGDVDERDIKDVKPADLRGYTQCHFFAGVGIWSYALRLAGWPDSRSVWTGSCPCQPFSSAGRGKGTSDDRHLWPHWAWLLDKSEIDIVLGEQVSSKDGRAWFDIVSSQMEGMGYAAGAIDSCSAGVGAPHIRQRLHWLAVKGLEHSGRAGYQGRHRPSDLELHRETGEIRPVAAGGASGRLADTLPTGRAERRAGAGQGPAAGVCGARGGADANGGERGETRQTQPGGEHGFQPEDGSLVRQRGCRPQHTISPRQSPAGPTNGYWAHADWLHCRDGKWRPVEPGTFPLVNGASARVVRLRGYGDGINAEQTAIFIESVMDEIFGEAIDQ